MWIRLWTKEDEKNTVYVSAVFNMVGGTQQTLTVKRKPISVNKLPPRGDPLGYSTENIFVDAVKDSTDFTDWYAVDPDGRVLTKKTVDKDTSKSRTASQDEVFRGLRFVAGMLKFDDPKPLVVAALMRIGMGVSAGKRKDVDDDFVFELIDRLSEVKTASRLAF